MLTFLKTTIQVRTSKGFCLLIGAAPCKSNIRGWPSEQGTKFGKATFRKAQRSRRHQPTVYNCINAVNSRLQPFYCETVLFPFPRVSYCKTS